MAVNEIFFDRYPDSILEHQIQVRPFNALKTKNMRNLNPEGDFFLIDFRESEKRYLCIYWLTFVSSYWGWNPQP